MSYAIITGASGGIGLSMAEQLAARGYDLLLIARSGDKLQAECDRLSAKYKIKSSPLSLDLSLPGAVQKIDQWVIDRREAPEILINNAGYGLWNPVETATLEELENMMQLNMNTLVQLTKKMIPHLKQHKRSYILNVASTAAYQAVPTLATYAATKAFVVLFTRGLRWELKSSGISVTCLSPGATSTGFIDRAGLQSMKEKAEKFSMPAEAVAKAAIKGLFQGKAEIIPGAMNWISVKATYFLPKVLVEKIAKGLYE